MSRNGTAGAPAGELLRNMSIGLHDLSQPVTTLLCLLEYGSGLEASDEVKQVMGTCMDATERLRVTVVAMQRTIQKMDLQGH